ncbi:MAG TPA: Stk1 family PASTA domain-containing Ser/Thr kinase [Acidimicrobiales bacterium]|nr:Stk1 family PASTA domain-containing Ser/Thr kinase [Acidimicrobiales bacterium]
MSSTDRQVYSGRYELQRKVARGGMADVFLSRDLLLDRPVALKVLFPEFAADPAFVQRFRREAQSAARLNHPNVVSVFDWGQEGSTYFIVMEFVEGQSLAQLLRESGRMEPDRAAAVAVDVAAALAFAHEHGVVHRDVKPGNVMLARGGHVKVADFGIARAVSTVENLTQTGTVMGTATYFSPEQARGGAVDPRSDVYSLGIVLYEMLTGTPPFTGDNPVSVAYKHVQELPVPPRRLRADIPEGLEAIVLKAINKNPDNRYATAGEMREDLRRYLAGRPVLAEPIMPFEGTDITAAVPAAAFGAAAGAAAGALADPATRAVPFEPNTVVVTRTDGGYPPEEPRRRGWLVFLAVFLLLAALAAGGYLLLRSLGAFDAGADQVAVPDVVGQTQEVAEAQLRDAGLEPVVEGVTDPAPPGEVLAQDPAAGRDVDEGSSVTLRVSTGPEQRAIPDVVGSSEEEARFTLAAAGFEVGEVTEEQDDADPGTVLRQSPQPGGQVDVGSAVALVVSSGPPPVVIPDVRGMTEGAAIEALSRAGLNPDPGAPQPSDTVGPGLVINTEPGPGRSVRRDSRVVYVLSSGPTPTTTSSTTTTSTTSTTEPDGGGDGGGDGDGDVEGA